LTSYRTQRVRTALTTTYAATRALRPVDSIASSGREPFEDGDEETKLTEPSIEERD